MPRHVGTHLLRERHGQALLMKEPREYSDRDIINFTLLGAILIGVCVTLLIIGVCL